MDGRGSCQIQLLSWRSANSLSTTPEVLALRHLMLRELERFLQLGQVWKP